MLALIPEFQQLNFIAQREGVPAPFLCEAQLTTRTWAAGAGDVHYEPFPHDQRVASMVTIAVFRRFFTHMARVIRDASGEPHLRFDRPFPPPLAPATPPHGTAPHPCTPTHAATPALCTLPPAPSSPRTLSGYGQVGAVGATAGDLLTFDEEIVVTREASLYLPFPDELN